jgi:hypothetical protein
LVQAREREVRLRLDTHDTRNATRRRPLADEVEQRGLAHPRLAAQDQNGAVAGPYRVQQLIQRLALAAPAAQPGSG